MREERAPRKREIRALMKRVRRAGELPTSVAVVRETFQQLGLVRGAIRPDDVLGQFDRLLQAVFDAALPVLERHEERSYAEGISRELIQLHPEVFTAAERVASNQCFQAGVIYLLRAWYPLLRECFLSVSQSRKARGGKDFELEVEGLLDLAATPYDRQERENRTDLILPNARTFSQNRTISAVVSVKRTLRERWAEVAEELFNLRSPNVFLFTADEDVTQGHVDLICERYNIYLVVWDHVKARRFPGQALVLGYTEWATQRLPALRQFWR